MIAHYYPNKWSFSNLYVAKYHNKYRASDISLKKIKILRDFQGKFGEKISRFRGIVAGKKVKIHEKIGQFHGIFAGKKSKLAEKSADFAGF